MYKDRGQVVVEQFINLVQVGGFPTQNTTPPYYLTSQVFLMRFMYTAKIRLYTFYKQLNYVFCCLLGASLSTLSTIPINTNIFK